MCEALVELFRDEIDAMAAEVVQQAREQALEQGLEEGLQQGMQQGIEIFIQTCNELGVSRAIIFSKLKEKFGMSEQESGYYIEKYC